MQAAGGEQHDLSPSRSPRAEDRRAPLGQRRRRRPRRARSPARRASPERRRLAPAPHAARVLAATAPALEQRRRALPVLVPGGVAGGEVGVDHERQRADADEVVEDRGDGVVGDVGEAVDALALRARPARSATSCRAPRAPAPSVRPPSSNTNAGSPREASSARAAVRAEQPGGRTARPASPGAWRRRARRSRRPRRDSWRPLRSSGMILSPLPPERGPERGVEDGLRAE